MTKKYRLKENWLDLKEGSVIDSAIVNGHDVLGWLALNYPFVFESIPEKPEIDKEKLKRAVDKSLDKFSRVQVLVRSGKECGFCQEYADCNICPLGEKRGCCQEYHNIFKAIRAMQNRIKQIAKENGVEEIAKENGVVEV